MKLMGVEYGNLWNSSGARGFFGDEDEYWYHKYWRVAGMNWNGYTFVAKTTTFLSRIGNMPLDSHWRPSERCPRCIVVKPVKGVVLNAVGLSGPGLSRLLHTNKWQHRTEPFVISYMPTGDDQSGRLCDAKMFGDRLTQELSSFRAPFALQVNVSCPNVEHKGNNPDQIIEILKALRGRLFRVPLIPKFNALEPVETVAAVARHSACAAVAISNTIPWGEMPGTVNWKRLFGSDKSPLAHLGGGGLSGWPLLPLTAGWLDAGRRVVDKPIVVGGGIWSAKDARQLLRAGADCLELGVLPMLRPWRMGSIRREVYHQSTNGDLL